MELLDEYTDRLNNDIHTSVHFYVEQIRALLEKALDQDKRFETLSNQMASVLATVGDLQERMETMGESNVEIRPPRVINIHDCIPSSVITTHISTPKHTTPVLRAQQEVVIDTVDADADAEPEALLAEIAEQTGGVEEESAAPPTEDEEEGVEAEEEEEEEEEEEKVTEEVEKDEEVELELFQWKGKTYYKDPENRLYRSDGDGGVEDEPFAKFDSVANRLVKILPE